MICTSGGQNDAGLFEVNLRDERWLPFEGQGAISTWTLTLDPRDNTFDVSTITDIILHLRYTAAPGSTRNRTRRHHAACDEPLRILVSVGNAFSDAYYAFFNPTDTTTTTPPPPTLTLTLTPAIFPFSNLGTPTVNDVVLYIACATAVDAGNIRRT